MCSHRLLLLALVLSTLSYVSYFERNISVMSLRRLVKAIFLFKSVKSVVLVINCIKRLWLLIIRFFKVRIFKNYIF